MICSVGVHLGTFMFVVVIVFVVLLFGGSRDLVSVMLFVWFVLACCLCDINAGW